VAGLRELHRDFTEAYAITSTFVASNRSDTCWGPSRRSVLRATFA